MAWIILFFAGLSEVGWAVGLKYTEGFTRLVPSVLTITSMVVSLGLLGLALKTLPLGTAYAIWTGIGTIGTALLGIVLFGESASALRLACIGLIVAGIVGLKLRVAGVVQATPCPSSARMKMVRAARRSSFTGLPPAVGSSGAILTICVDLVVADLQARQRVRNAGLLAQLQHEIHEGAEARPQADIGGEPLDLVLDGLAVEREHVRHEHRIGEPVMRVVERADRMRERVDRAEPLLERGRAGRRRRHHVGARLDVACRPCRPRRDSPSPAARLRPRCRRRARDSSARTALRARG